MLRPIAVELLPHDPNWAVRARAEIARLGEALGETVIAIEHIGSTSIPGIRAKPIIDLLAAVTGLPAIDAKCDVLKNLGYAWHGENGIAGRRYCTLSDPVAAVRLVHLHVFTAGTTDIVRHLAFRDGLRGDLALAAEYDALKQACRTRHPKDSHAYADCKNAWIARAEAEFMASATA